MTALDSIGIQLAYSDAMNGRLFDAAGKLDADKLDQPFDMGMGTLRKTLRHICVGEKVWLERWKNNGDTPWPPYESTQTPAEMSRACDFVWRDRDRLLESFRVQDLGNELDYRDSKGSRYRATLHEMILQGLTHSTHHRAQAVNMIRRLGGPVVEVDFMYWSRRPV